jgi:hypothetical protein
MIQIGTTLKAPALARHGDVYQVRRDGKTLICRAEERREGVLLVVTALCGSLQSQEK